LSATGVASWNAVTFAAAPAGVCKVSGTKVTVIGAGTCTVTASQAGNANYTAAADVAQSFTVAPLAASVTPDAANKAFGAADPIPLTTGTLTGFLPGDAVTATYSRTGTDSLGTYTISATLAPAGVLGNYTITYNTALFTIGLGRAAPFAVLGGTGASSCTGVSTAYGNVGVYPSGTISGFPSPCAISAPGDGSVHLNDAIASAAQADVTTVNAALAGMTNAVDLTGQDLGGLILTPGVYRFTSSAQLTGELKLNGPANGIWVFQIGSTLTTAASSKVTLQGTANAGNVYWQVGSSATIGATNAPFVGNIIATATVGLGASTSLTGRALAKATVIMDTNIITLP
ncbi:MAG: ice-binding family protein, partial [Gemmatimonadales bacterium]